VISELERLHGEFVLVPADKACNKIVFVCKAHYYNCILNELGINMATPLTLQMFSKKLKFLKTIGPF
jgi:hypothetical protein